MRSCNSYSINHIIIEVSIVNLLNINTDFNRVYGHGSLSNEVVYFSYVFELMNKYEKNNLGRQKLAQHLNEEINEFL